MARIVVVTPAAAPVVSLADAKKHMRIEHHDDDDAYVEGLVAAAAAWLEGPTGWLGRSLLSRTLRLETGGFAGVGMRLPCGPVTAIGAVAYVDAAGVERQLDPVGWFLAGDCTLVYSALFSAPALSPRPDAVRITYTAGYASEAALPLPIRQAILLLTGHWYENREAVQLGTAPVALPMAVEALLAPYRLI